MTAPPLPELLFVYGSLRRDSGNRPPNPMHQVVARHCRFLGNATCRGHLYDLGGYPGLVLTNRTAPPVRGELYQVLEANKLWPQLDHYEDYEPSDPTNSEYIRRQIDVTRGSETLGAWTYLYNRSTRGKRRILSGNWCNVPAEGSQ